MTLRPNRPHRPTNDRSTSRIDAIDAALLVIFAAIVAAIFCESFGLIR
jgi:hypothetical protein